MDRLLAACIWMYASIYADPQTTSSGEKFTGKELTAASRYIPNGEWVFIAYSHVDPKTKQKITKTIAARINDSGPFVKDAKGSYKRDIDISARGGKLLDFPGTGKVCVQRIFSSDESNLYP